MRGARAMDACARRDGANDETDGVTRRALFSRRRSTKAQSFPRLAFSAAQSPPSAW